MMANTKMELLILKGSISELEAEDQAKVKQAAQEIRDLVAKHGDQGQLGLMLVTLELAAE